MGLCGKCHEDWCLTIGLRIAQQLAHARRYQRATLWAFLRGTVLVARSTGLCLGAAERRRSHQHAAAAPRHVLSRCRLPLIPRRCEMIEGAVTDQRCDLLAVRLASSGTIVAIVRTSHVRRGDRQQKLSCCFHRAALMSWLSSSSNTQFARQRG